MPAGFVDEDERAGGAVDGGMTRVHCPTVGALVLKRRPDPAEDDVDPYPQVDGNCI